jgi:hypothetical protein
LKKSKSELDKLNKPSDSKNDEKSGAQKIISEIKQKRAERLSKKNK